MSRREMGGQTQNGQRCYAPDEIIAPRTEPVQLRLVRQNGIAGVIAVKNRHCNRFTEYRHKEQLWNRK